MDVMGGVGVVMGWVAFLEREVQPGPSLSSWESVGLEDMLDADRARREREREVERRP